MPRNPYDDGSDRYFTEYEGIPFEQAHARFLDFLPKAPVPIPAGGASGGGSDGEDPPHPASRRKGDASAEAGTEGCLVLDVSVRSTTSF